MFWPFWMTWTKRSDDMSIWAAIGYSYLAIFCFMMVLQLLWVHFFVPETKNVPLEEMEKKLGIT